MDYKMDYRSDRRGGRGQEEKDGVKESVPRYSRLFVLGGKGCSEEEIKETFCRYGHVEHVKCVKDRATNMAKGLNYVKFAKTSQAAEAMEELEGKTIGSDSRPIKIVIASERTDGGKEEIVATGCS